MLLRWPHLAVIMVILGGAFVSYVGQGGVNVSIIGVFGLLCLWLIHIFVLRKRPFFFQSKVLLPVFGFVVATVFAFIMGQFSWYPVINNAPIVAQLGGFAIYVLSIGAFLYTAHFIADFKKLKLLVWSFVAIGGIYIVGRVLRISWIDSLFEGGFTRGSVFWIWISAILAGQVLFNNSLSKKVRMGLALLLMMTFYVEIIQAYSWKSGWFPPLISVGAILAIRFWDKVRYFAWCIIFPLYYLVQSSLGSEQWSEMTRIEAWKIVLNISKVSPILGLGFGNYYWYAEIFPILGYFTRFNSHSQYIDIIAQIGIVGLACYLWIIWEVTWIGLRLLKRVPDGFVKGYVSGALGGLAGMVAAGFLVDWILPFAYNIGMVGFRASVLAWIFLGGLIAVEQILKRHELPGQLPQNVI